jgi:hypothetical protein
MKSKELIRQLQEADPSGEIEVCIDNADIHFVETMSAYWDGKLQVLKRDHSKDPYFNIVGGKYVVSGSKIKIYSMSITDLISEFPDEMEIDYSELGSQAQAYKDQHEKTRALGRDIERRCELGMFQRWAEAKAKTLVPDYDKDQLYHQAERFFDKNLSPKDPLPELPPVKDEHGSWWPSVSKRREHQWDNSINFGWSGLDFEFSKK